MTLELFVLVILAPDNNIIYYIMHMQNTSMPMHGEAVQTYSGFKCIDPSS